jgi:hypothetical protein
MARDGWRTRARVESEMTCTAHAFLVTALLEAHEGETRVFGRAWSLAFPRDHL